MNAKHSLITLALCGFIVSAQAVTFYVSPRGNDAWDGSDPDRKGSSVQGPLLTIKAALDKAGTVAQRAINPGDPTVIVLRGGYYPLNQPLEITPDTIGASSKQSLTIRHYKSERPVVHGGTSITGWRRVGTSPVWQTTIPEVREGKWYFRQLFVNGERAVRARTPNDGFFRIVGESPKDNPVRLHYRAGDIKKPWAADGDVEVVAFLAWGDLRMQIRSVDDEKHVATLSGNPQESNRENNAQYYIENAPDAFDCAGEWYLDRKTGVLKYWTLPGQDMTRLEVVAPRLDSLLRINGDFKEHRPVSNLSLRGITFSYTDWALGEHGYADTQAAFMIRGALKAEGLVNSSIEDCEFSHLANYAIDLGRGCRSVKMVGNDIFDMGAGGIRVGEPNVGPEGFDQNSGHVITDNHIHHLGEVYKPAIGVFVIQSGNNRIAHNHIHDLYYTAVSLGWTWGYQTSPCHHNIVEYNHLHDIGKGVLSDMGAVYTLGIQEGTVIRNNLVHDVDAFTYGGWGLYTDEGSTHILLEKNIVYRTKSAGFHQHYGKENIVRNNIFALGREHQLMRSRKEQHSSFTFERNIVYFNTGELLGSNWDDGKYEIDNNIYFDARKPDAGVKFQGLTFEEWQSKGRDTHSLIADPLFKNPAKLDFRLKPGSPAGRMGIEPISTKEIGIRKKRDRT